MGKKINALRKQVKGIERQLKAIKQEVAKLQEGSPKPKAKKSNTPVKAKKAKKAVVKTAKAGKVKVPSPGVPEMLEKVAPSVSEE